VRQIASWGGRASRAATATLLALTLTVAAGIGAGRSLTHVGGPPQLVSAHAYGGDLLAVLLLPLVAVLVLIVYAFVPARWRRRSDDEPEQVIERPPTPWWLPWALLLITLAAVGGLSAALFLLVNRHEGQPTPSLPPPPFGGTATTGRGGTSQPASPTGVGIHWWIIVLALAVLAVVVLIVWLRGRERSDRRPEPAAEEQVIQRVVLDSLDNLRRERDPRRAVLLAYAMMETTLGSHGFGRQQAETALEYLLRTRKALHVDGRPLQRLTTLFERAKFSSHTIDQPMKKDAITSLEQIAHDLQAGQP
jgi:membrane protein implicated in regulation of membrane protease activity